MLIKYKMAKNTQISSGTPLLVFTVITTIYYIIKYNLDDSITSSMDTVYFVMYILILVVTHFFMNLNMTRAMCGSNQWETTFIVTAGPWIVIFGFLFIALKTFPSWLMPFSNTIGYGLALLAGLSETTEKLFKSTEGATKEELGFLEKIYTDKSLIINEITINNFPNFWQNMKGLFRDEVKNDPTNAVKKSLYQLVKLKELAAEYIWYVLAGLLITSVSYNFIINASCKRSVQDMQEAHNQHEQQENELQEAKQSTEQRLYTMTD
jgi:hypothetical protein